METVQLPPANEPNDLNPESVALKTVRLLINLLTNVLMALTVFVCLVFSCISHMDVFQLHIILSVLGYQFFMCQGILVLSEYNGWSFFLSRTHRRYLHISFQLIGVILAATGSILMMKVVARNFRTVHGCLGIITLVLCFLEPLSGLILALNRNNNIKIWLVYFHHITGVVVLLFSAITLCTGFDTLLFRLWMINDDLVAILMFFTLLFTILVALDFWIVAFRRIKNKTMDYLNKT